MDNRSLQRLLREIDMAVLVTAISGAIGNIQAKVLFLFYPPFYTKQAASGRIERGNRIRIYAIYTLRKQLSILFF